MPKAKITKNNAPMDTVASTANRSPVRVNATGTPMWYKVLMFAIMIIGLTWLVVYYLAGDQIPFMLELGPWNYLIGFAFMVIGLLMTMGWR